METIPYANVPMYSYKYCTMNTIHGMLCSFSFSARVASLRGPASLCSISLRCSRNTMQGVRRVKSYYFKLLIFALIAPPFRFFSKIFLLFYVMRLSLETTESIRYEYFTSAYRRYVSKYMNSAVKTTKYFQYLFCV